MSSRRRWGAIFVGAVALAGCGGAKMEPGPTGHDLSPPPPPIGSSEAVRVDVDLMSPEAEAKEAQAELELEEARRAEEKQQAVDTKAARDKDRDKHKLEDLLHPKGDGAAPPIVPGGDTPDEDQVADDVPPRDPKPTPAAASSERIGGSIDPTEVRQTLSASRDAFLRCLQADMKLELDLTITPAGDVIEAAATSSAPDDIKSRDCVVSALRRVRFKPFSGTDAARISLGLALRR
ncbi:MAG TPA: hypothetical protein VL400_24865 [Polyangiaceae bacterium]|nr:hypothetical protein [Polyangiaceae bacterium]